MDAMIDYANTETFVFRQGLFYNTDNGVWTKFNCSLYKASSNRYIGSIEMYEVQSQARFIRWYINGISWTSQQIAP